MASAVDAPPLLDAEHAAFITGGLSILAASRDATDAPSVARVHGCRVSADRRVVTIFVARGQAGSLIDDVERCGALAVVFSYPPTHRTIQLKCSSARVRLPEPGETDHVADYVEAFTAGVLPFGYEPRQMATLFAFTEGDLVAIDFVPESAFVQTPGPKAGAPMPTPAP
jgi:hypothetical protein